MAVEVLPLEQSESCAGAVTMGNGSSRGTRDDALLFVGVDLGATKCLGVSMTLEGKVVTQTMVPTPAGSKAVLDTVTQTVRAVSPTPDSLAAVGIGVPGMVDGAGVLRIAPNMPDVVDIDLSAVLHDAFGVPVRVENDATCAAWGEYRLGAAAGFEDVIGITLGTGIGGGVIVGGKLHRGAHGFAGEVGHFVVHSDGPLCGCGRRGCWETFASGTALGRMAREAAAARKADHIIEIAGGNGDDIRGHHVTFAAQQNDPQALELMGRFGWWVALGLSNLALAFDPQAFVLAGGLAAATELFLQPVRDAYLRLVPSAPLAETAILPAKLGPDAGAIGAAFLSV